jgi:hypothetical protein
VKHKQHKGSATRESQLNFFKFHCLLQVSAFGKTIIRQLKIHTMEDNLSKIHQNDTFSTLKKIGVG